MVDTKQTKTVGEHYAAAELARRGWAPALTRDGLERTDILAVKTDEERRLIEVQVKAAMNTAWRHVNWPLGDKSQQPSASENEYFVMVGALIETTIPPRFFVLPRAHVAAAAWITHQNWLTEPGIPVGKRNVPASRSRVHIRTFEQYEDRWDLLDIDESKCPVLLPTEYRTLALDPRVGLPEGHAWHSALPSW
ncbi:hypothetical protein [Microbacterium sp. zg-YB36]|uniref:hypothetical protein n=1 Tax=Microbacterium sp. zg-YB36 TaxID=2969407 RepID=UPI00214B0B4F|nr:hypothetical protein [Microbacterium sp. zg-YB36]MDL5350952.1 hypothetical protein [Microbacterium sp. zg-YB36]